MIVNSLLDNLSHFDGLHLGHNIRETQNLFG